MQLIRHFNKVKFVFLIVATSIYAAYFFRQWLQNNQRVSQPLLRCFMGGASVGVSLFTSSFRPCFLCSRQISLALISCRVSLETAYCSRSIRSTAAAQADFPNFFWSARIRSNKAATQIIDNCQKWTKATINSCYYIR